MKKQIIILGFVTLLLTGCQQQLPYSLEDETIIEKEEETTIEKEDEHEVIVDEYRAIFNEYKADLESKKEVFDEPYIPCISDVKLDESYTPTKEYEQDCNIYGDYCSITYKYAYYKTIEGSSTRIRTVLNELRHWTHEYNHMLGYYVARPNLYHTTLDIPAPLMAEYCKPFVDTITEDLEDAETYYNEINNLLFEVNDILNELDSLSVERIAVNKIELENRISKMGDLDVRGITEMYDEFYPAFGNGRYITDSYTEYLYPDIYERVFGDENN